MENDDQLKILQHQFGPQIVEAKQQWGQLTVVLKPEALVHACQFLRDEPGL